MPETRVQDEQGTVHVFPDGSTPEMIAQALGVRPPASQSAAPPQTFWQDPRGYLQKRAVDLQGEAQNQTNLAMGPESVGKPFISRLGHRLLSLAPETAAVVDKTAAGLMDWKNAGITAAGLADPAIPAAYFMTRGAGQLTGLEPGINKGDTSPENVQNALLAGATVAGGAAAATSPKAGTVANPKPVLSRAVLLGRTPGQAYESALKPSTTMPEAQRAGIVNTGLTENIPVSKGGLEKIADRIDELNNKIAATIQTGAKQGAVVDPQAVAARTGAVRNQFATQVTPKSDLEAIDSATNEFLSGNQNSIPLDQAQAMKQGTYRALGKKAYGEMKGARVEAEKALARGLKEEIAVQFPEIGKLNASESQLLDLQPALERAVNRIGNHQLGGIGAPITAGATRAITGSGKLAAAAGLLKAVLDDPYIKSKLAIALSQKGVPHAQALARVQSYQSSLGYLGQALPTVSNAGTPTDQKSVQP